MSIKHAAVAARPFTHPGSAPSDAASARDRHRVAPTGWLGVTPRWPGESRPCVELAQSVAVAAERAAACVSLGMRALRPRGSRRLDVERPSRPREPGASEARGHEDVGSVRVCSGRESDYSYNSVRAARHRRAPGRAHDFLDFLPAAAQPQGAAARQRQGAAAARAGELEAEPEAHVLYIHTYSTIQRGRTRPTTRASNQGSS